LKLPNHFHEKRLIRWLTRWVVRPGQYEKHFVSKLTDADAEQLETQHWLETAADSGYLTQENAGKICDSLREIGKMLNSMIAKGSSFCRGESHSVREKSADYFVDGDSC
jgi:hypothetical protein